MIKYPAMKRFSDFLIKAFVTVIFIGYIPFASGTLGTLAAIFFVLVTGIGQQGVIIAAAVTAFAGAAASYRAEKLFNTKDSGKIVIDEFCGYLISILFLPLTMLYLVSAFLLFRFFDIFKPFPVSAAENLPGGLGVMADDIAAGALTCLLIHLFRLVFSV
ncbi:MAG: phosphatidylglycerophosphatase A [Dissulfurispiraceae bacterium]|nr:phosphatidylglycerophosphatase A [Dissulfurispiraceae bacterium]